MAQRANVSVTWYTWLEQGRGGAPSADVLDRLASALILSSGEREHLYLLAQHRPPEIRARTDARVTPALQRVLDSLAWSPAFLKTAAWDVVAWNQAAAAVLTDYGALIPQDRNALKLLFLDPVTRAKMPHWETDVRGVVQTLRLEAARAGGSERLDALIEELNASSPEFAAIWREGDVRTHGEGGKIVEHPAVGLIELEYATFAVDDQPDLALVIYTAATPESLEKVRALIARRAC